MGGQTRRIAVGVVRSPHGLHGFVNVTSLSGEVDHLLGLRFVYLDGETSPRRLLAVRRKGKGVIIQVEGVEDVDAARQLVDSVLYVPRDVLPQPGPDEYFLADLTGCRVIQGGRVIGLVCAVIETGAADLLEIERPGRRAVLVPFVQAFVEHVDVAERRITMVDGAEVE